MAKKNTTTEIGRNVTVALDGDTLTLTIDLSAKAEPSGSGKTMIIATTQGNKKVNEEVIVGLNVYRYAEKKKK
jgi:hypothetical protein